MTKATNPPLLDPRALDARNAVLKVSPFEVYEEIRESVLSFLQDFSELHSIPVAMIINGEQEYLSPNHAMSKFCRRLWGHEGLRTRCLEDHRKRNAASPDNLNFKPCHAGLLNISMALDLGELGKGALLAGQRPTREFQPEIKAEAEGRFQAFLDSLAGNERLAEEVRAAREALETPRARQPKTDYDPTADVRFVRTLGRLLETFIKRSYKQQLEKIQFERGLTRLLHEASNTATYIDLNARGLSELVSALPLSAEKSSPVLRSAQVLAAMAMQNRYECQNLLESLDRQSVLESENEDGREFVDPLELVRELWPSFEFLCEHESQEIRFESQSGLALDFVRLPRVFGFRQLLLRALFNVFANALKYSFRSVPGGKRRFISVRSTERYTNDGGRFAISFSSMGVCFSSEEERQRATEYGFRGQMAVAESPIGSGIGLAEVKRILSLHNGFLKLQSDPIGKMPAHTVVWLIFEHGKRG